MKREWKPGDVAMVTALNRSEPYRATYDSHARTWRDETGGFCVDQPTTLRLLVVIDPEDREQVERLIRLEVGVTAGCPDALVITPAQIDRVQTALREFANPTPPTPEEPTGLGAVVEDEDGQRWILVFDGAGKRYWVRSDEVSSVWTGWSGVSAVRVLSEGVPSTSEGR